MAATTGAPDHLSAQIRAQEQEIDRETAEEDTSDGSDDD